MRKLYPIWSPAAFLRAAGGRGSLYLLGAGVCALLLSVSDLAVASALHALLEALGLVPLKGASTSWLLAPSLGPATLVVVLLAAGLLRTAGHFAASQISIASYAIVSARLQIVGLHQVLGRDAAPAVPSQVLHHELHEIYPKAADACRFAVRFATGSIHTAALAAAMLLISPAATALAVAGILLGGVVFLHLNRITRARAAKVPARHNALIASIERIGRSWLLLRVLRTQEHALTGTVERVLRYMRHFLRTQVAQNAVSVAPIALGTLLLVAIIVVGIWLWPTPGAHFVAFLYLLLRLVQSASGVAAAAGRVTANQPQLVAALERVDALDAAERSAADMHAGRLGPLGGLGASAHPSLVWDEPPEVDAAASGPTQIEARDLAFVYEEGGSPVVQGVELAVGPGERCAVAGRSGSGKSTLLALLAGVLQPTRGEVLANGVPASEHFAKRSVRIGYVGPEPYLIAGTVRENLDYGSRQERGEEERLAALEAARLREVVEKLPGGLDTLLEPGTECLSSGEKQRLCLARALLSEPQLLILDEVSANLDAETEGEIAESIRALRGRTTVLVASHRPAMREGADVLVDLDSGEVVRPAREE